jgi:hypothetical protein
MSISSTGLYGSATIVNSDLFNDVKEQVTTLSTSYLDTTREHRTYVCTYDRYIRMYVCMYVCMYVYVCMYACMFIYIPLTR